MVDGKSIRYRFLEIGDDAFVCNETEHNVVWLDLWKKCYLKFDKTIP